MRQAVLLALLSPLAACSPAGKEPVMDPSQAQETIKASDGKTIYAMVGRPAGKARAVILLFHQANSSSGEYAQIAKRLNDAGFMTIATDQRSGGNMYGVNRTVRENSKSTDYESAYPDLEGAVTAAKDAHAPIVAWGSSYSSSLVFKLAGEHSEVKAVVAFSPGEYFAKPGTVAGWAAAVKCPVFVACGSGEEEKAKGAVGSFDVHSHPGGVHGSSTLMADKSKASEAYWADVLAFLDKQFPSSLP